MRAVALLATAGLASLTLLADVLADDKVGLVERAAFNYQLLCQGCHTPDGSGAQGVPQMRDVLGYFLRSDEGRAYLVRVPGSANAALNDAQLAEVLNWMLREFSADSLAQDWRPLSADEVTRYRREPLFEVDAYRQALLEKLVPQGISPSATD